MLGNREAVATIPVKDLRAAGKFYVETLGLRRSGGEGDEYVTFETGKTRMMVYRSKYAGTNQATAVTWTMGKDLDDAVRTLKGRGVKFEHYDMPDTKREGDVHVMGGTRAAWFKDPDGNIHALVSG